MKPQYLEGPFQFKMAAYGKAERIGYGLSKEQTQELKEYTTFKTKLSQSLNLYISELTGSAMGEDEAIRLKKAVANLDDSPSEFSAKFEAIMDDLRAATERYRAKLSPGGLGKKTGVNPSIGPMIQPEAPEPQEERDVDPESEQNLEP